MFWIALALGLGFFDLAFRMVSAHASGEKQKDDRVRPTFASKGLPYPFLALVGWSFERFKHFSLHFALTLFFGSIAFWTTTLVRSERPGTCVGFSVVFSAIAAGVLAGRTSAPEERQKRRPYSSARTSSLALAVGHWIFLTLTWMPSFALVYGSLLLSKGPERVLGDVEGLIAAFLPWIVAIALTFEPDREKIRAWRQEDWDRALAEHAKREPLEADSAE